MVRYTARRIKSFLKRKRRATGHSDLFSLQHNKFGNQRPADAVDNYYRRKAMTNLPVFYRFALQTRSLNVRDTFAKAASDFAIDLQSLVGIVQECRLGTVDDRTREHFISSVDPEIILSLADLLANTARNDFDTTQAIALYEFVASNFADDMFAHSHKLQHVEALLELGYYQRSAELAELFEINSLAPLQAELLEIQKCRRVMSLENWLASLNNLYDSLAMTTVRLSDETSLAVMDRLVSASTHQLRGPKISVIMPTYAPGQGIYTAVRSLLQQTWQNLEIIIVNDASPVQFNEVFDKVARMDSRIQVLHQEQNAGAYVARNAGLARSTGDFITTHDDDDWSHPDKLAKQVQIMLDDPQIVATTSGHIRTTEALEFKRVNMQAKYLQMNYSSLMFRSGIVETIGRWDTVNRGGDSEFYTRLQEYFGPEKIVGLHHVPLAFSRVWDGSLTSGEMSRGYFSYSRLLYRWSFRQWHWDTKRHGDAAVRSPGDVRPYAVPSTFESGKRKEDLGHFDVIYVSDFFRQAKYVDFVVNEIDTLSRQGYRIGYMHLYSPETTRPAGIPKRLFELQLQGKVHQVSHDDTAHADLLLVYDAAIGMFVDQLKSTVRCKTAVVIEHTLPKLSGGQNTGPTRYMTTLANLDELFGTELRIVGATEDDQKKLHELLPPSRLMPDSMVWHVHISDPSEAIKLPIGVPVVGFHSYGNHYRWPSTADELRRIYFSPQFKTKFYGHLDRPIEKFGSDTFNGSELVQITEMSESEFLDSLDFWVYAPHHRLNDQVWTPVLAALQRGKLVVLPPRFANIYGDACVYAEAHEIDETVRHFTDKPDAFIEQAKRGQDFVSNQFDAVSLCNRIDAIRTYRS